MAINKKLVHFKKLDTFNTELSNGNILNTSIVFIQDANMIWTHGTFYPCPYTKDFLDSKFTSINEEFTTVANGSIRSIEVSISVTQPTEDNYLFWINPDTNVLKYRNSSDEWITLNVLKDPNDGLYYVRKNKQWTILPNEAFVGTTLPTGEEILWMNPETLETKYKKDDGTWELIKGGTLTETVNVSLSSNQSDADLTGAEVTVSYEGVTKTEVWDGRIITFQIPPNTPYTISTTAIEGYAKPANISYTAEAGKVRDVEFIYNGTLVRLNWVFNYDNGTQPTVLVQVEDESPTEHIIPDNILVPTGATYTVTPQPLSGYRTPEAITQVAEGTDLIVEIEYIYPKLYIVRQSNLDEALTCSATVTYGSNSETVNFDSSTDQGIVPIPYNTAYTVTFSDVEGYKTPDPISGTAQYQTEGAVGTYKSELVTVNVSGQGNTPSGYTITIKQGNTVLGTQTTATKNYKIPFDTQYTVSASSVTGFVTPTNQTFTANLNTRTVAVSYVYDPTIDLSMYDIHGVRLANRTTANCYVVSKPGTYKFPLVYGNGIKNGLDNKAAYTNVGGSYTADFCNIKEAKITSPYIETDLNTTIIWAKLWVCDTDGVFSDISVIDGTPCRFIQFTVKKVPKTGANGVIAAASNIYSQIAWSWHIWVWEDDLTPKTITNHSGNKYLILPVNLGSKWDEDSKVHIKNWFYLLGRPSPQIGPSAYNSTTRATNYGVGTIGVRATALSYLSFLSAPELFFTKNSSYNWVNLSYFYNFWDANCTATGANDNKVVKTVYDPCPPGYCVGNGNVFTGFTTTGLNSSSSSLFNVVGSFSNGWKFKANSSDTTGIFFPASGYVSLSDGTLGNSGLDGDVRTSALSALDRTYSLNYNNSRVHPLSSGHRAHGLPVRPVKEQ